MTRDAAERRSWTFYEAINFDDFVKVYIAGTYPERKGIHAGASQ